MKKEIKSKSNKEIIKTALDKGITTEQAAEMIPHFLSSPSDPKSILNDLAKNILPKVYSSDKKERAKGMKEMDKKLQQMSMLAALDKHYALANTVTSDYRPMVINMANNIIKEYDCKTDSEKALAEIAAGAYVRSLQFSSEMNGCFDMQFLSSEKIGYYSMVSREADKLQRRYISAITALRQLKAPPIEFTVKAQTAFVSQNQQINAGTKPSSEPNIINDPK